MKEYVNDYMPEQPYELDKRYSDIVPLTVDNSRVTQMMVPEIVHRPKGDYHEQFDKPAPITKHKYDIHYTIGLLKQIMRMVQDGKSRRVDMTLGIEEGIRKMISMLEIERDQPT